VSTSTALIALGPERVTIDNSNAGLDLHIVVFDVNIYLDVARLLGPPFSWDRFDEAVIACRNEKLPHPHDAAYDSLRAIAVSRSGRFAGSHKLEVWTSAHIEGLVRHKAAQPVAGSTPEERGLGWLWEDADNLVASLVGDLVYDQSFGGTVGEVPIPYGAPPLSHEDGCVYETARSAGEEDQFPYRYCVTRDRELRQARLPGEIDVLFPHEWVQQTREARRRIAMQHMKGDRNA
jgi:hypothetical protein